MAYNSAVSNRLSALSASTRGPLELSSLGKGGVYVLGVHNDKSKVTVCPYTGARNGGVWKRRQIVDETRGYI